MDTNFHTIEILSAAHDAEQLKAMRKAQMPRSERPARRPSRISTLFDRFSHTSRSHKNQSAVSTC